MHSTSKYRIIKTLGVFTGYVFIAKYILKLNGDSNAFIVLTWCFTLIALMKYIWRDKGSVKTTPQPAIKSDLMIDKDVNGKDYSIFDPANHIDVSIPDKSGNYMICLKHDAFLPQLSISPVLSQFEGLNVIYVGLASKSLRNRDYRQHFKGNNAGRSTLRKTLGVMMGFKQIKRDNIPNNNKTKFSAEDEKALSHWMRNNLIMYYKTSDDFAAIEIQMINEYNPPLNLASNKSMENAAYRRLITKLRKPVTFDL